MVQGQPVNEQLLSPKGSGTGLQALVPSGMRAVTIEVNEFTGIAGLLNPGMNVDVVSTFRDDVSRETVTRTIVQDVKVLAVGPRITPPGDDQKDMYHSVTLLAKPHDAERIELAAFSGHPRLSLRSGRDNYTVASRGTNIGELASGDSSEGGNGMLASLVKTMARNARVAPTTQRTEVEATKIPATPVADPFGGEQPRTMQRKVTVIRNGVETTTVFEVPRTYSLEDLMTGAASERAPIEPK
jgi:Flp pilus assembly protein CpaB